MQQFPTINQEEVVTFCCAYRLYTVRVSKTDRRVSNTVCVYTWYDRFTPYSMHILLMSDTRFTPYSWPIRLSGVTGLLSARPLWWGSFRQSQKGQEWAHHLSEYLLKMSILGQKAHWKPQNYTNHASYEYNTDYFSRCSWKFHPGKKNWRSLFVQDMNAQREKGSFKQNICDYVHEKLLWYKISVVMLLWNVYDTKHLWLCYCEMFMIQNICDYVPVKHLWLGFPIQNINENSHLPHQWEWTPST